MADLIVLSREQVLRVQEMDRHGATIQRMFTEVGVTRPTFNRIFEIYGKDRTSIQRMCARLLGETTAEEPPSPASQHTTLPPRRNDFAVNRDAKPKIAETNDLLEQFRNATPDEIPKLEWRVVRALALVETPNKDIAEAIGVTTADLEKRYGGDIHRYVLLARAKFVDTAILLANGGVMELDGLRKVIVPSEKMLLRMLEISGVKSEPVRVEHKISATDEIMALLNPREVIDLGTVASNGDGRIDNDGSPERHLLSGASAREAAGDSFAAAGGDTSSA